IGFIFNGAAFRDGRAAGTPHGEDSGKNSPGSRDKVRAFGRSKPVAPALSTDAGERVRRMAAGGGTGKTTSSERSGSCASALECHAMGKRNERQRPGGVAFSNLLN